MILKDFLRYSGVFKKSVQGKMCLFYRILKLVPGKVLKNAPWRSYTLGPNNSRIGSFLKNLKVTFDCQLQWKQVCPRASFPQMTPQQVNFEKKFRKNR